jgi:hypothetical protein
MNPKIGTSRKVQLELSAHGHLQSLIMRRGRQRNVQEARAELLEHYRYKHNHNNNYI